MTIQDIIDAYFDGCLSYREAFNRLVYEFNLTAEKAAEYLDT